MSSTAQSRGPSSRRRSGRRCSSTTSLPGRRSVWNGSGQGSSTAVPARNIVEAINNALDEEMGRDDRVMLLGLDVGRLGGVFRATTGLVEKYGDKRVVDTPLAEASIIGASLGLAVAGMLPVAEIQFLGFTAQGFHQ